MQVQNHPRTARHYERAHKPTELVPWDTAHRHNAPAPLRCSHAKAFTLIELLVVIGIITILLAILVPVVSSVQTSARVAKTDARILALSNAIENYKQVFGAYPGPLLENQIQPATAALPGITGTPNTPTGTENLTLGLLGGLQRNTTTGQIQYSASIVGQGPSNLNPLKPKQYGAFIDPIIGGLDTQKNGASWRTWSDPMRTELANQTLYKDTEIPEFVDAFPDPKPIIYIRTKVGANGVIAGVPSTTSIPAYDPSQLASYAFPAPASPGTAATINNNSYTGADPAVLADFPPAGNGPPPGNGPAAYFAVPADPSTVKVNQLQPRQKDGYLLISAGADRKYMTADDRLNGGAAK